MSRLPRTPIGESPAADLPDYDAMALELLPSEIFDPNIPFSCRVEERRKASARIRSAIASATGPLVAEVERLRADLAAAVGLLRDTRPYLLDYACDKIKPGSLLARIDAYLATQEAQP